MNNEKIITRLPPSPTGKFHIGTARTALFNYAFAKQNGGEMLFRFEDTDKERSKEEYESDILNGLEWLEIEINKEKIFKQSERGEVYKKYLEKMIADDKAYISKEDGGDREEVIRFKNPNVKIKFNDLIRGDIEFDTTELGDFVIAKSIDEPLYHLVVVIDDLETEVTHVIRGEDGISNTPRQILIQEAIGAPRPKYAHLPLILASDRSKMSKRHGAVAVMEYKEQGYLPGAILNHLMLLGWNPGTDQEIFSLDEFIKDFDLSKVQKSGAIFNIEKLNWVNSEYLIKKTAEELGEMTSCYMTDKNADVGLWNKIVKLLVDDKRIEKLSDIKNIVKAGELDYFFEQPKIETDRLNWKNEKDINTTKRHLEKVSELLSNLDEKDFNSNTIKESIWDYAEQEGRGNVLWPFRMALTGLDKSPDPITLSEILGKQKTIERVQNAINQIK